MRLLRTSAAVVAGLLLLGRSVAAPTNPGVLQPITPWDLDYGVTQCTATRDFGSDKDPVTFGIVPAPEGDTYELLVGMQRPPPAFAEELEGTVNFGKGPIKAWLLRYASTNRKLTIYQFRISSAEMAQARSASSISFHVKGAPDVSVELDTIRALLDGLEKCTADLRNYWNQDGEKDGRIAVPSKGDVRAVFSADDYPYEASSRWQQGTAQYLLMINEKGLVAGCHVIVPSGVPILDVMGCAVLIERAKFKPALDRSGKPVRSMLVTPPVKWQMKA